MIISCVSRLRGSVVRDFKPSARPADLDHDALGADSRPDQIVLHVQRFHDGLPGSGILHRKAPPRADEQLVALPPEQERIGAQARLSWSRSLCLDAALLDGLTPATNTTAPIRHRIPDFFKELFRTPIVSDETV